MSGVERIDLALEPLRYPGPPATGAMVVLPHCRHPVRVIPGRPLGAAEVTRCRDCVVRDGVHARALDNELRAGGVAPMAGRAPVVAVGSNASPAVIRTKLGRAGVDPMMPLFPATVRHLRIGVSAHVSRPGFLPAAPARVPGDQARVVVGWPDREQLAGLDATEPNYHRILLSSNDFPLRMDGVEAPVQPVGFELYDSRWGVLTDSAEPGAPLRLPTQAELCVRLAELGIEPWRSQAPAEAVRTLAGSEQLRTELRVRFRALGLVTESGLPGGRERPPLGPDR